MKTVLFVICMHWVGFFFKDIQKKTKQNNPNPTTDLLLGTLWSLVDISPRKGCKNRATINSMSLEEPEAFWNSSAVLKPFFPPPPHGIRMGEGQSHGKGTEVLSNLGQALVHVAPFPCHVSEPHALASPGCYRLRFPLILVVLWQ